MRQRVLALHGHAVATPEAATPEAATPEADPATPAGSTAPPPSLPGSARRSTVGTPSSVVSLKALDGLLERMQASVGKPVPKPRRPQPPRPEREGLSPAATAEAEWTPAPELVAAAAARAEMERQPRQEQPQKPRSGLEEVFHAMAEETALGLGAERARDAERIRELEAELENTRELCRKQVREIVELRERVRAGGLVQRAGGAVQQIMGLRKEVGTLEEALGAEREARAELERATQEKIAKLKADYDVALAASLAASKSSRSSSNKTSKSSSSSEDLVNHALTKEITRLSELTAGLRATVAEKDAQVRLLQKQRASAGTPPPGKAAADGR